MWILNVSYCFYINVSHLKSSHCAVLYLSPPAHGGLNLSPSLKINTWHVESTWIMEASWTRTGWLILKVRKKKKKKKHSPQKILHFDPPGCVLKELWDQSRWIQSKCKVKSTFRYFKYHKHPASSSKTLATLPMTTWPNGFGMFGFG